MFGEGIIRTLVSIVVIKAINHYLSEIIQQADPSSKTGTVVLLTLIPLFNRNPTYDRADRNG